MLAGSVDEAAAIIRRVSDEMYFENDCQLIGTDCVTVDATQVCIHWTFMHTTRGPCVFNMFMYKNCY